MFKHVTQPLPINLLICQYKTKGTKNIYSYNHNYSIGKPLPSNEDEPMAYEYELHGDRNSDIFICRRHRKTLKDPKLPFFFDGVYAKKLENNVPGVLVTLIPCILRG